LAGLSLPQYEKQEWQLSQAAIGKKNAELSYNLRNWKNNVWQYF
jgi:hypothetical protein